MNKYVKTYSDTYFYKVNNLYEQEIFKYLMSAKVIDKTSENFEDAKYQIKRRAVNNAYVECMESNNVVFLRGSIYKPFTVITAKDIRQRSTNEMAMHNQIASLTEESKKKKFKVDPIDTISPPTKPKDADSKVINEKPLKENNLVYDMNFVPFSRPPIVFKEDVLVGAPLKVFVNVSSCMSEDGKLNNPEYLVAYLTSAIVNLMYYKMPEKLFNGDLASNGADCFCKLLTYVVDYMCKISVMSNTKNKCQYLAYKYFYNNIAVVYGDKRESITGFSKSLRDKAIRYAEISEREAAILDNLVRDSEMNDIKSFIEALSDCLKLPNLNIDNFTERWMYLLGGPTTAFGLEYFPNFSAIMTDAYTGAYLNNQKTIEKICGQSMVAYTKYLLDLVR